MINTETSQVVLTDIKMPFMPMVLFMVKAAIAAIPAFILLGILGTLVAVIFGGIFGGLGTHLSGRALRSWWRVSRLASGSWATMYLPDDTGHGLPAMAGRIECAT
jgi:hypothetical protein